MDVYVLGFVLSSTMNYQKSIYTILFVAMLMALFIFSYWNVDQVTRQEQREVDKKIRLCLQADRRVDEAMGRLVCNPK